MASQSVSLFFPFLLFVISADGRSLQKNYTNENIDLSHDFSLATNSYTGQTNYNDVLGLVALCTQYKWLVEENDDPCLPPKWTWIECNSDAKPRIIALDLNSKILVGELPDFSSMDALQRIDLSENSLYGPIPSFLGTFPDLQEMNLAYNLFYGAVPDSLACNKNLELTLTGNTNLYTSNTCSTSNDNPSPTANRNSGSSGSSFQVPAKRSRKKSNLPVILGSTIAAFGVFWIAVGIFAIYRHKAKTAAAIAEASAPGPSDRTANLPTEEMPITAARTNNMSP